MARFIKNNGSQPVADGTVIDTIHASGEVNYGVIAGEPTPSGSHPHLTATSWRQDPDLPCTITHWRHSDKIMDCSYKFDIFLLLAVISGLILAIYK